MGINVEKRSGLYLGSGYVVLHVPLNINDEMESYVSLAHNISWCENPNEIIHATWFNMPIWCKYCHTEGHSKFECSKSKSRIICYGCRELGHRSFECPRSNPGMAKKRKTPKEPTQQSPTTTPEETINTQPSQALQSEVDQPQIVQPEVEQYHVEQTQKDQLSVEQSEMEKQPRESQMEDNTDGKQDQNINDMDFDEEEDNASSYAPSDKSDNDESDLEDQIMESPKTLLTDQMVSLNQLAANLQYLHQNNNNGNEIQKSDTNPIQSVTQQQRYVNLSNSPHITNSRRTSTLSSPSLATSSNQYHGPDLNQDQ
jgi:hypothetical protein